MAKKETKSTLRGRDAGTGKFIPIPEARRRPGTTVIERIKKAGNKKKK